MTESLCVIFFITNTASVFYKNRATACQIRYNP